MSAGRLRRWMLRPDLGLVEAEPEDGVPALLVHDPVAETFDRVDWPEADLLRLLRRPIDVDDLRERFRARNPLDPSRDDVAAYLVDLGRRGWLRGSEFWPERSRPRARGGIIRLLAGLLFVQLPLFRPERFLKATAGAVAAAFNPLTRFVLILVGLAGLYFALPRWEDYWRDSLGGFDLASLPAFLAAVVVVKTVHELGHAYQAAIAGARVPAMGVALFFFMPLPYTDVTDAWRLGWRARLAVATAGLRAELALAGVALFLWALSPPGAAASTLARLSSVALVSTLAVNLNPGPRFDGYYILVCLLRLENLRQRGGALLWGLVGRVLLGVAGGAGSPTPRGRRGAVLAYAAYAFLYRVSLGAGLVAMAYHFLPRALGAPAAAGLGWLFFGMPVAKAGVGLWRGRRAMRMTPMLGGLLAALAVAAVWFFGAWPRRVHFPAVTRADAEEAVRLRAGGKVARIDAGRGDRVVRGQALAVLEPGWREFELRRVEARLREAELAEGRAWYTDKTRGESPWRAAEVARRRAEAAAVRGGYDDLAARAPVDGVLAAWDADLEPGVNLPRGYTLGWVAAGQPGWLVGYAPVDVAYRLEAGSEARFFADDGTPPVTGEVISIDPSRAELLDNPPLAAALGAVADRGGALTLPRPYARVAIRLAGPAARMGQTGRVWVRTRPESLAVRAWNWFRGLAVRESAF